MHHVNTAACACALAIAFAGTACTTGGATHDYFITPDEMREVYGVYQLSNGDTMRVMREQRRYWIDSRQRGRKEIRAVAWMEFESVDGSLRLRFTPGFTTLVDLRSRT